MSAVNERTRSLHRQAQIHTDEMLARVCQPEPCCFVAPVEDEPTFRRGERVSLIVLIVIGLVGLWLSGVI